jgi:hypothetical protein
VTVATIESEVPEDVPPDMWQRDTIHRWAHAMAAQTQGDVRRYSPGSHRPWRPRRRRPRRRP